MIPASPYRISPRKRQCRDAPPPDRLHARFVDRVARRRTRRDPPNGHRAPGFREPPPGRRGRWRGRPYGAGREPMIGKTLETPRTRRSAVARDRRGDLRRQARDLQQVRGGMPGRDDGEAHVRCERGRVKLDVRLERRELSPRGRRVLARDDVLREERRPRAIASEEGDAAAVRQPPVTAGDEALTSGTGRRRRFSK
jgi:hypothetical protein